MERSIHDNELLGYSVDCKSRTIVLRTLDAQWRKGERTDVVFEGVSAYWFEGDNFGTILLWINEKPAADHFEELRAKFEKERAYGWPGFWNDSEEHVRAHIERHALRSYDVASAVGMAGWVWARSMTLREGS